MNNLPAWVSKVQSIWFAVGAFIAVLATQGVAVPDVLGSIFSEAVWTAGIAALGSVISFVQIVRAIFAKDVVTSEVMVLSSKQMRSYWLNPFKINIAA